LPAHLHDLEPVADQEIEFLLVHSSYSLKEKLTTIESKLERSCLDVHETCVFASYSTFTERMKNLS
jgi:hypothetical protein